MTTKRSKNTQKPKEVERLKEIEKPKDTNINSLKKSDYIALFFVLCLFAVDFLPDLGGVDITFSQFFIFSLLNIIMGGFFLFNPEYVSLDTVPFLKKSIPFKLYLSFICLGALSITTANNFSLSITRFTELIIIFGLVVNFSILLKNKSHLIYHVVIFIGLVAFFKSAYQIYILKLLVEKVSLARALGLMVGNAGNINILAATLTIKIPFLFIGITHFSNYKKGFFTLTLILTTTVILLTAARTAMINLFLIYSFYIIYYLKTFSTHQNKKSTLLMIIVPVLISILISNFIFSKVKDNERFNASIGNRIERINELDTSSKLRLLFWKNALKMAKSSPITGVGLGNYLIESLPYERYENLDGAVSRYTHNDFLEVTAETGFLNGLIYLSLFIFIFFTNLKKIIKPNDETTKTIAIIALLTTVVFGIDSSLNFPMYRGTMIIGFCLLFVLTVINNESTTKNLTFKKDKNNLFLILIFVAIITSYFSFSAYKATTLEKQILNDRIINPRSDKIQKGGLTGDYIANKLPLFPNVMKTSQSFAEYAGVYYVQENNIEKALKYLSIADKINPYLGGITKQKEIIYRQKGDIDSAYVYAKEGLVFRPKNLKFYQMAMRLAGKKKDSLEVLKQLKKFITYTNVPKAWNIALNQLQIMGYNKDKTEVLFKQALKYHPKDEMLLKQKNVVLVSQYLVEGIESQQKANYDKASKAFHKALEIDPTNVSALQYMAFHYYVIGNHKQAIPYFLKALKRPGGMKNGKVEFFLAVSYLKTRDKANACKYFQLSNDKKYPNAQQAILQNCN